MAKTVSMSVLSSRDWMTLLDTAKYTVFSTLCDLEFNGRMKTMLKNNSPSEKNRKE
ncbi:hypothetical protein NDK43_11510 [Neobacillus pocheonensis]|uniref:Uncharacterized protein n=1 Tax=Neobacillus pocheonensis TaxID=363869 RepID=A0ABT0WBI0_9BACI|nr:hypothetical protein [Neobacillus pocheonensis]